MSLTPIHPRFNRKGGVHTNRVRDTVIVRACLFTSSKVFVLLDLYLFSWDLKLTAQLAYKLLNRPSMFTSSLSTCDYCINEHSPCHLASIVTNPESSNCNIDQSRYMSLFLFKSDINTPIRQLQNRYDDQKQECRASKALL